MNRSLRILTASLVTFVVGSFCVYDTIQQNSVAYQSHPAVAVITAFWGASLSGLIFYFGSGWFFKKKARQADSKDSRFYEQVAGELQAGPPIPGLWTRAYAETSGDEAKARALYIQYRVQQLRSEAAAERVRQKHESERLAEAAKPPLKWYDKAANLVVGIICGVLALVLALSMIGPWADANDGTSVGEKVTISLVLGAIAFGFGLITRKCMKALNR